MAVGRQFNWRGQQRVDIPHLRLIESAVAFDFDTLAGSMLGGRSPYVLKGFSLSSYTIGTKADTLRLVTAGGLILNYGASENGSMLVVPDDRLNEVLSVSNARVAGGFTASATNYIGVDFVRSADSTTADIVQFLDATTLTSETPKTIPLGRTLDYKIVISTTPFSSTPNLCPIAKVVTNASNLIVSVEDARTMYFRLAQGGDSPNPLGQYSWPQGRTPENPALFTGGDKAITDEKTWKSAVMQRLWEVTGGEYWYSDTTDRNVRFLAGVVATLADNFTATFVSGTTYTIRWENVGVALTNSTASRNDIENNTAGGLNIADGQCIYVDIDRTTNRIRGVNGLTAAVGTIAAIGTPTRVGSRYVLAWNINGVVNSRIQPYEIGRQFANATTTTFGVVKTNSTTSGTNIWAVVSDALNGNAIATGLTRGGLAAGNIDIGAGANDTQVRIGQVGGSQVLCLAGVRANQAGAGSAVQGVSTGVAVGGLFDSSAGTNYSLYLSSNASAAPIHIVSGSRPSNSDVGDVFVDSASRAPFYFDSTGGASIWRPMGGGWVQTFNTADIVESAGTPTTFGTFTTEVGVYEVEAVFHVANSGAGTFTLQSAATGTVVNYDATVWTNSAANPVYGQIALGGPFVGLAITQGVITYKAMFEVTVAGTFTLSVYRNSGTSITVRKGSTFRWHRVI